MLEVTDLHAYYGKSHILQGVNMNIQEGEIVALLGRNGVGRSTTCKAIMGDVPPVGSVKFKGQEIAGKTPPHPKIILRRGRLRESNKKKTLTFLQDHLWEEVNPEETKEKLLKIKRRTMNEVFIFYLNSILTKFFHNLFQKNKEFQ